MSGKRIVRGPGLRGPKGLDGADSTVPGPKGDPGEQGPQGLSAPATVPTIQALTEYVEDPVGNDFQGALSATIASEAVAPAKADLAAVRGNPRAPTSGAVITFIDDDGDALWYDTWAPVCAAQGIKVSLCVIGGRVTGEIAPLPGHTHLTLSQLKAIEADGHDILSHSWSHHPTTTTDPAILDADYERMREWMDEHFPKCADVLVYPGGLHPPAGQTVTGPDVLARKNLTRKHARYGITTTSGPVTNPEPLDNWFVGRPNADTSTEAQMKAHVDTAHAKGEWLVFMAHAVELDRLGRAANIAKLNAVIDYAKSLGIPILPWSEAEKLKGNAVAIGEHTSTTRQFVSQRGKSLTSLGDGEGKFTWTPTLYGATAAGAHAYQWQRGFYEVVGGLVFLRGSIRIAPGVAAATVGAQAAVNVVTGGDLVVNLNGAANITVPIASGDTPAQAAAKVATAIGATGSCGVIEGIFRLVSTRTGPTSTATIVSGGGTVLADLGLVAGQSATGSGYDNTMSGGLRIGGLPANRSLRDDVGHPMPVNFNYFNLGAGYASVWAKGQTGDNKFLELAKNGSGVNEDLLRATDIDPSRPVILNFATVYMRSIAAWTTVT